MIISGGMKAFRQWLAPAAADNPMLHPASPHMAEPEAVWSTPEPQAAPAPDQDPGPDPASERINDMVSAIAYVEEANRALDIPEALRRSLAVVERHPYQAFGYASAASLMLVEGKRDDADILVKQGLGRLSGNIEIIAIAIEVALARGRWQDADRLLEQIKTDFADHPFTLTRVPGVAARIETASAGDRLREQREAATAAERAGRWSDAAEAWRQAEILGASGRDVIFGRARAEREAGNLAEAERYGLHAVRLFPTDAEALANLALLSMKQENWPAAASRWRDFIQLSPEFFSFDWLIARSYAHDGAAAAADALMERAIERDPANMESRVTYAVVAEIGERWVEAVSRWDDAVALRPGDPVMANARGHAMWHRELVDNLHEGEDAPQADPSKDAPDSDISLGTMVLDFESVGDNCEFGFVQRKFGAEPVGLLRFAAIEPGKLIELLDLDFAPLGDPLHTFIEEADGEYVVSDDRGYYWTHSFVYAKQVSAQKYLKQQEARITLLKRKLLTQLRAGGRVYVFKQSKGVISDATLDALSSRLQRYGDNILLGIRPATDAHPAGTVEMIGDHVCVGYLSWLFLPGDRLPNQEARVDHVSWERVITTVHAHLRSPLRKAQERETATAA